MHPRSTNTSYERWQQAVAAWDAINTRSRDTLRLLLAAGGRGGGGGGGGGARRATQTAASSARWLVAFCRALKSQLTEDSDLVGGVAGSSLVFHSLLPLAAAVHTGTWCWDPFPPFWMRCPAWAPAPS
jgi:hypothetical protein